MKKWLRFSQKILLIELFHNNKLNNKSLFNAKSLIKETIKLNIIKMEVDIMDK